MSAMTTSEAQHPSQAFDEHAGRLHAVATVLVPDPELAEHLVVKALTTARHDDGLPRLSTLVVRSWLESRHEELPTITPARHTVLDQLHGLPPERRAALALCRFGGHCLSTAAEVLGTSRQVVADHLTEVLRSLGVVPESPTDLTEEQAV